MSHLDVVSFHVTMPSNEEAQRFVRRVASALGTPVLRYDNVVHLVILLDNMKAIRALAEDLGGVVGYNG